jgi:hypothetical protein
MIAVLLSGHFFPRWPGWLEWGLLFLAPLPALLDWGTSTALGKPERANWIRLLTGVGLGIAIGANLQVNTRDLLGKPVIAQATFFLAAVWVVWVASYLRRLKSRRAARRNRPSLDEFLRRG